MMARCVIALRSCDANDDDDGWEDDCTLREGTEVWRVQGERLVIIEAALSVCSVIIRKNGRRNK